MSIWIFLPLILVLLPVGLFSVPLFFKAGGCLRTGERQLEAAVVWAWGLVAAVVELQGSKTFFKLRLAGIALPVSNKKRAAAGEAPKNAGEAGRPQKETTKQNKKPTGRKKKGGLGFPPVSLVFNRQLLAAVLGYLKRLFKFLNLRLRLSGIYGTDDPALTGLIAGFTAALHAEHYQLDLEADFSGPVLDLEGETSGRIVPMVMLWLTLRLLLSRPVRVIWWTMIKRKLKRRKKLKEDARYV